MSKLLIAVAVFLSMDPVLGTEPMEAGSALPLSAQSESLAPSSSIVDFGDFRLLAISSSEESVVLHVPGEGMQLIRRGESFYGDRLQLISVAPNRLVVEESRGRREKTRIFLETVGHGEGRLRFRRMQDTLSAEDLPRSIAPLMLSRDGALRRVEGDRSRELESPHR